MEIGNRILIIGSGGAGKSTLARRLGDVLGLPVIHLDAEYWHPGWVETPKDVWRRRVEALMQGERWIMDGNFGGTMEVRLAAATTVIFLDFPAYLCAYRVIKRWAQYRGKTRPDMGPGCLEKVEGAFLKWVCFDFPRTSRRRILQRLDACDANKQILILRSPGEVERFVTIAALRGDTVR